MSLQQPNERDKQLIVTIWSLYQQAFPWFEKFFVAPPPSRETLAAAMQTLVPVLQAVKETPKPQDKKFQQLKRDVETVLDAWIKASEWGIKYAESPNRAQLANMALWTSIAFETMKKLHEKG